MLISHQSFCNRFCGVITSLLLCLSLSTTMAGQQVIVTYRGEEKPTAHHTSDGRILDFPEQIIMATLKATSKASIWSQDSMMFLREGVFADGFRLFAPGQWEYRNKMTGKSLIHRLYYGEFEFVETNLTASLYNKCGEWIIEPKVTKSILGILSTKATRQCLEGEQIAYFTRSIAIVDGPIYISTLPGLVLEFDDGKYNYTAQRITANESEVSGPKKVKLIREDLYPKTDTRVVVKKPIVKVNTWINLYKYYLIH